MHLVKTVLLKLLSSVSVSDIVLLQLSDFHVNHMNICLDYINCLVCYKAKELRSGYGANLLTFLSLIFSSGVFLQNVKIGLKNKKVLCKCFV